MVPVLLDKAVLVSQNVMYKQNVAHSLADTLQNYTTEKKNW